MGKSKKQDKSDFLLNRYEFFRTFVNDAISKFPEDLLDGTLEYFKDNDVKFTIPSRPELHTIDDWDRSLAENDKIRNKILNKKELLTYVKFTMLNAVFQSDWFNGIGQSGFTEIFGPVIATFIPSQKIIKCRFIQPYFLWAAEIDKSKSYIENICTINRELICGEVVDILYYFSIYNDDFGFGETGNNIYEKINNAIEHLVESSDLYNNEEVIYSDGLIGIITPTQYLFSFSPIYQDFSININNMIEYHDRKWLDDHKLL